MTEPVYRCKRTGDIVDACEAEVGIEVRTLDGRVVTDVGDMLTYHPDEHGYRVWARAAFYNLYEVVADGNLRVPQGQAAGC